jgi:8-oxo-dGTP pyrophosphatase MutT (NUDIX family)
VTEINDPTRWTVEERPLDLPTLAATRRTALSIAHVTLPDGVEFEQAVLRVHPASMCVLVDDQQRVLMLRRHRFISDIWVWELPGGYVDEGEDPADCAAREAEEETGWRPSRVEHLASFQPMTGNADALNHVYLGLDPVQVSNVLDINEAAETRWIPLADALTLVRDTTLGAASVVGLLATIARLGIR